MKDTEIEIQVKVDNVKNLKIFLHRNGKYIGKNNQIDEYYTPIHRDFLSVRPIKEWLRLRMSDRGNSITYKNWKYGKDGKSWHCDEYETKIDNIEQLRKIFKVLNYKLITRVNKNRTTYKYKNYEVSLDRVLGLGNFVEIENKSVKRVAIRDTVKLMITFLKKNKCGKIQRNNGGYPFMLMFPKEVIFEDL